MLNRLFVFKPFTLAELEIALALGIQKQILFLARDWLPIFLGT